MSQHDPLTSTTRPSTDSIITVRVIKSFTYRTSKNLVLPHVNLELMTVRELQETVRAEIAKLPAFKPYRAAVLDTLKIYSRAHGSKTTNLIINFDRDDWVLSDPNQTLTAAGLENEAEVSLYNAADYEAFKENPETKW